MNEVMSEIELENGLKLYREQLRSVESALILETQNEELTELKSNLQELIHLTEESLISLKKEKLLSSLATLEQSEKTNATINGEEKNIEAELGRFQKELDQGAATAPSSSSIEANEPSSSHPLSTEDDPELNAFLTALEGKKCRAPHRQQWGELAYHNAVILNVKASDDISSVQEIEVEVMFCNPTCQSMKPCEFFMEGHCRFDTEQCRFSHGNTVKLSELQEFLEPDYSNLGRDSNCLAKYKDGLWYRAIVEELKEDHKFTVKYSVYDELDTLDIKDILPLEIDYDSDSSSSDEEETNDFFPDEVEEELKVVWIGPGALEYEMGDWEKYTKGIGSRLMEQMGYIKGKGLGKNGEGRVMPVEVVVLPQGKSLDKCMEIRERQNKQNANSEENAKDGTNKKKHSGRKNLFDFINSKMASTVPKKEIATRTGYSKELKESCGKGLNVRMLKVTEDLKKAHKEMKKLKESLKRNKDRDKVIHNQLERKIEAQERLITNLKSQEKLIDQEQSARTGQKKLTIF